MNAYNTYEAARASLNATDAQRRTLTSMGVTFGEALTKAEASALIREGVHERRLRGRAAARRANERRDARRAAQSPSARKAMRTPDEQARRDDIARRAWAGRKAITAAIADAKADAECADAERQAIRERADKERARVNATGWNAAPTAAIIADELGCSMAEADAILKRREAERLSAEYQTAKAEVLREMRLLEESGMSNIEARGEVAHRYS